MKVLIIVFALLLLLALLRVGALLRFGEAFGLWLRIGPFKIDLLKKKEKKKTAETTPKVKKPRPKPTWQELTDLAKTALKALKKALRHLKRTVRIDPLRLSLRIADSDPAKCAQNYGYVNAAVWTLMPLAEDTFDIPDARIHTEMDFEAERISAEGEVGISLRVFDVLAILLVLLVPLLKWYLRFTKAHKNDPPQQANVTEETTEVKTV